MTANNVISWWSGHRPRSTRSWLTAQGTSSSVHVGIVREVSAPGVAAADRVSALQCALNVNPNVEDQAEKLSVVGVDAFLRIWQER